MLSLPKDTTNEYRILEFKKYLHPYLIARDCIFFVRLE
jgi:hypothetical protein